MILLDDSKQRKRLIEELKADLVAEKKIISELKKLRGIEQTEEKEIVLAQKRDLKEELKKVSVKVLTTTQGINFPVKLVNRFLRIPRMLNFLKKANKDLAPTMLERETLKRFRKGEEKTEKKKKDNKEFAKTAQKYFAKTSNKLIKKGYFDPLENDLLKSNLRYTLPGYVSIALLATTISFVAAIFIFAFFMFFNIEATFPIIKFALNDVGARFAKTFWMVVAIPAGTFIIAYLYPSIEKKSAEAKIDYELPFATINMAAISGSMIDPTRIFEIISSTGEFPAMKKELTKLLNSIHIYGHDIVNALINTAEITPSDNLSELFNGLATTINSGGDLPEFFEKRAETLLFDYKIKREKETKTAETFMDLYISVVIAAPMIFMLLLMMLKISGLGLSISTSGITLMMVLGVAMINVFFMVFLKLKNKDKGA